MPGLLAAQFAQDSPDYDKVFVDNSFTPEDRTFCVWKAEWKKWNCANGDGQIGFGEWKYRVILAIKLMLFSDAADVRLKYLAEWEPYLHNLSRDCSDFAQSQAFHSQFGERTYLAFVTQVDDKCFYAELIDSCFPGSFSLIISMHARCAVWF